MTRDLLKRFPALATLEAAPFSALAGLNVEDASIGSAVVRMPFDPRLLNYGPPDVPIHGGATATLRSATISMTVNYTGPGIQSDLVAHAQVRRKGKRVASITVEIRDNSDALIADALVTYKIA
jgi:acyl-coenzyme A thioesterase PaaI-like protein